MIHDSKINQSIHDLDCDLISLPRNYNIKPFTQRNIPGAAMPGHEIAQELPLIEQLPEPHYSIFLQSRDLSDKGGHKISRQHMWNMR